MLRFLLIALLLSGPFACASSSEHCHCPVAVSGQVHLVDSSGPVYTDASRFIFSDASGQHVDFECAEPARPDGTCSTFDIEQVFGAATLHVSVDGYAPASFDVDVQRGPDCCGLPTQPFDVRVVLQKS